MFYETHAYMSTNKTRMLFIFAKEMEMCNKNFNIGTRLCSYSMQQISVHSYTRIENPATVNSTVYIECPLASITFRENCLSFSFKYLPEHIPDIFLRTSHEFNFFSFQGTIS